MCFDIYSNPLLTLPQPPFEELKKDNGSLKRDKLKFEEILRRFEERRQKWLRQVQDEKTELEYNCTCPACAC